METLTKKRSFAELLASDKFIVSAELTPPRHFDTTKFMEAAGIVSEYVDVVQLNDHLLSRARLSNLVAGMHCKNAGLEPILQFTLRHRNRIALQGDLLGFANLGLENVIILGGYPCAIGTDPEARDATDLGSVEAIASITALTREGKMFNGDVIKPAPKFTVGTIDFPCATDKIEDSMKRLTDKIDAGAKYIQVQAIFELGPMQFWMAEVVRRGLHKRARFLAAIFPFSWAECLHVLREIPGLSICWPAWEVVTVRAEACLPRSSLSTVSAKLRVFRACSSAPWGPRAGRCASSRLPAWAASWCTSGGPTNSPLFNGARMQGHVWHSQRP